MQLRSYSITLLKTTFLLLLTTGRPGFAISLRGVTIPGSQDYFVEGVGKGTVTTTKVSLLDPRNKNDEFLKTLSDNFKRDNGWIFKWADTSLEGNFSVERNEPAFGYANDPYLGLPRLEVIGAKFELLFFQPAPESNNPLPQTREFYWIQRVSKYDFPGRKGDPNNFIDVPANQNNPFYNLQFAPPLETSFFRDEPSIDRIMQNNTFLAELYLAELSDPNNPNKPQEVTIYDGVSWGWENTFTRAKSNEKFSGTLSSGYQIDQFKLDGLTHGSSFYAWTNNNIPSNRCNPNTYLAAYNDSGSWYKYDNDSSPVGDGYASALAGTVSDNGIINLTVQAASGGRRGEDRGDYELFVDVYDPPSEPEIIAGSSGGGGVIFERPRPGNTQQNPILPTTTAGSWQIFNNVPSCRWYDPPHNYGFEFQALENTLFTEILDFPVGLDNRFTVSVGNNILGEFSPGDSLDFVSLLGYGVPNFKITGIEALIGSTPETAFPIQLAFNNKVGSFQMRPLPEPETPTPQQVPEPGSALGLLVLGAFGGLQKLKHRLTK